LIYKLKLKWHPVRVLPLCPCPVWCPAGLIAGDNVFIEFCPFLLILFFMFCINVLYNIIINSFSYIKLSWYFESNM
jgi:hypothetical protein